MQQMIDFLEFLVRNAASVSHNAGKGRYILTDEVDSLLSAAQWLRYFCEGREDSNTDDPTWVANCKRMDGLCKHLYPNRPAGTPLSK